MKTSIVSISEDQSTVTHESGLVSIFSNIGQAGCENCDYNSFFNNTRRRCKLPCCSEERKDMQSGHFKVKKK